MSLSATEIAQVLVELRSLEGARIRRIHQQDRQTLLFRTRESILTFCCHARACRLHLVEALPDRIPAQDFCQLSRRRLEGKRIASLEQPGDDRCVRIRFESDPELSLVMELTGRHANLLLLSGETILGSLLSNRSHKRQLLPNHLYTGLLPAPSVQKSPSRFDDPPSASMAAHYGSLLQTWRLDELRTRVTRPLRRELKARRRLVKNLIRDRDDHKKGLVGQRAGDLLLAQLHQVKAHSDSVTLPDLFHDGPGQPPAVEISLDPRLSPADNAQRHYRRAKKARRGMQALDRRIPEVEAEVVRLQAALVRLDGADLATLQRLAAAAAPPKPSAAKKRGRSKKTAAREPYHRFESTDGLAILVGRSAADNDRLTFSVARGRDGWLHARDVKGAHVVLRLDAGGEPPHESLLDAACLAKHYSDARSAAHADISWTLRKYVRNSNAVGRVSLGQSHTLRVSEDPDRLRRLRESRSETNRLLRGLNQEPPPD